MSYVYLLFTLIPIVVGAVGMLRPEPIARWNLLWSKTSGTYKANELEPSRFLIRFYQILCFATFIIGIISLLSMVQDILFHP